MGKLVINSYDEFAAHLGEVLGTSEWLEVDQDRINLFADATLDHQWIHVDVEKAKVESPYKSTIAHGYLTLSLLPYMWDQIIEVNNLKMMVNYGMDKMKFGQPVITGSSVRLVTTLQSIVNLRGTCKAEIKFTIEIKDSKKPALEGAATFLYYLAKQHSKRRQCQRDSPVLSRTHKDGTSGTSQCPCAVFPIPRREIRTSRRNPLLRFSAFPKSLILNKNSCEKVVCL